MNRGKTKSALQLLLLVIIVLFGLTPVYAQGEFKLKDGAGGKICLSCHDGMQEKMDKPFVHAPLADGDCTGCHNPHASSYEMLMSDTPESICYSCHESVIPERATSVHRAVSDGPCVSCHDPHASENEFNLLKEGSNLCYECHQTLADRIKKNKFEHPPLREGCLGCHNSHASEKNVSLLNDGVPALCLSCHDTDSDTFTKLHRNFPVENADCTFCHDPHGSSVGAMLYDNVHDPLAKGNCSRCHAEPTPSEPFGLKAAGSETCQACHYDMITEVSNQSRIHWPFIDKKGCMNCHNPHASKEEKLLQQPMIELCRDCHGDTVARQERATTKHPPIAEGQCGECHSPHGSDNQFMLKEDSTVELCATCHEWQTHTTHPIGEEFVDPRNKNLTVQCESCHRTHGTEYKYFLYFSTTNEQCVQCHVNFRR